MDFKSLSITQRADNCIHIAAGKITGDTSGSAGQRPGCNNFFVINSDCGNICCGHCPEYGRCAMDERCDKVWVDPHRFTDDPTGRTYYVLLATGEFVSGSVPCIISEMYDDNVPEDPFWLKGPLTMQNKRDDK